MIMRKFWFYVSWPKDKLPTTYVLNVLDHSEVTSVVGKLTFGQKTRNQKLPRNNSDKKMTTMTFPAKRDYRIPNAASCQLRFTA